MKTLLHTAGIAGLLLAGAVTAAVAGDPGVAERQAIVTDLGGTAAAVTYWVRSDKGFEVVTTVDAASGDETARPAVVRVSAVLQPGQQQVVSVPGPLGREGATLRIVRIADHIEVRKDAAVGN